HRHRRSDVKPAAGGFCQAGACIRDDDSFTHVLFSLENTIGLAPSLAWAAGKPKVKQGETGAALRNRPFAPFNSASLPPHGMMSDIVPRGRARQRLPFPHRLAGDLDQR